MSISLEAHLESRPKAAGAAGDSSTGVGVFDLVTWLANHLSTRISVFKVLAARGTQLILAALGISSLAAAFRRLEAGTAHWLFVLGFHSVVEVAVLFAGVWLVLSIEIERPKQRTLLYFAAKSTRQLRLALVVLIVLWIFQYCCIGLHDLLLWHACASAAETRCANQEIPNLALAAAIFNYCTSMLFICINTTMAKKTTMPEDRPASVLLVFGFALALVGIGLSTAAVWADISSNFDPQPVVGSSLKTIANALNGIYLGLTMSIVMGRLQSRFLNLSSLVVAGLFLYALVQPVYQLMDDGGGHRLALLVCTFALKVLFILACAWAMAERRMIFFMRETRYIIDHMGDLFGLFTSELHGRPERAAIIGYAAEDVEVEGLSRKAIVELRLRNMDVGEWYVHALECDGVELERARAVQFHSATVTALQSQNLPVRLQWTKPGVGVKLLIEVLAAPDPSTVTERTVLRFKGLRAKVSRSPASNIPEPESVPILTISGREVSWPLA